LREIYLKIAPKVDEICAKVACTFHGVAYKCGQRFCLGKMYHNTKVASVAVKHSIICLGRGAWLKVAASFVLSSHLYMSKYSRVWFDVPIDIF